jgi:hypothetical protein
MRSCPSRRPQLADSLLRLETLGPGVGSGSGNVFQWSPIISRAVWVHLTIIKVQGFEWSGYRERAKVRNSHLQERQKRRTATVLATPVESIHWLRWVLGWILNGASVLGAGGWVMATRAAEIIFSVVIIGPAATRYLLSATEYPWCWSPKAGSKDLWCTLSLSSCVVCTPKVFSGVVP